MVRNSREGIKEEAKTVDHFMKLLRAKFRDGTSLQDLAQGRLGPDYEVERSLLMQVNQLGWTEGQVVGIVTFLFLRRRYIMSTMNRFFFVKRNKTMNGTPVPFQSNQQQDGPILQVAKLTLDVSLSMLAAISASLYFTDQQTMLQTLANTPLVQGRSVVSDEFCSSITQEFHKLHPPDYWQIVESPILQAFRTFTINCQKRAAYEAQLRNELGINDASTPIAIPPPGVPTDYNLTTNISITGSSNEFADETTIVLTNQEDEDDWAKAFVTDQEFDDTAKKGDSDFP